MAVGSVERRPGSEMAAGSAKALRGWLSNGRTLVQLICDADTQAAIERAAQLADDARAVRRAHKHDRAPWRTWPHLDGTGQGSPERVTERETATRRAIARGDPTTLNPQPIAKVPMHRRRCGHAASVPRECETRGNALHAQPDDVSQALVDIVSRTLGADRGNLYLHYRA
jgi:hypothetical protein